MLIALTISKLQTSYRCVWHFVFLFRLPSNLDLYKVAEYRLKIRKIEISGKVTCTKSYVVGLALYQINKRTSLFWLLSTCYSNNQIFGQRVENILSSKLLLCFNFYFSLAHQFPVSCNSLMSILITCIKKEATPTVASHCVAAKMTTPLVCMFLLPIKCKKSFLRCPQLFAMFWTV